MVTLARAYIIVCFAAAVISSPVQALALVDYPHAVTVFDVETQVDDYRLTLGNLKKINSRWRADREQRLGGFLTRKTFELQEDDLVADVFGYYRRQLLQLGGRELFYCRSRDCGSSNAWANTRFHIKQLYGLDSDQYYSAFEVIDSDDLRSYVALYAVRRGNNRSYLQLDVLKTRETPAISSSADSIVERLAAGQSFSFVDLLPNNEGLEATHLSSLVDVMKRKRSWSIAVVGHDFSTQTLQKQRANSLLLASRVKQQLEAGGIDPNRIEVFGLGGLVPGVRLGQRESVLQVVVIAR